MATTEIYLVICSKIMAEIAIFLETMFIYRWRRASSPWNRVMSVGLKEDGATKLKENV